MMKKLFIFLAAAGVVFGCQNNVFAVPEDDNEAVLFIVDFSNSMAEKFRGVKKIDMVLETIDEILPTIPRSQKSDCGFTGTSQDFSPQPPARQAVCLFRLRRAARVRFKGRCTI